MPRIMSDAHHVLQRKEPTEQIIKCTGWPCFHPQKDTQPSVLSLHLCYSLCPTAFSRAASSTMQEIQNAVQCRARPIPSLRAASSASPLSSEKDSSLHSGSVGLGLERTKPRGQEVDILSLSCPPAISGLEGLGRLLA